LKKFPNHGETQAMKGLILNAMEKKEEAYELVKSGIKNDIRSHVCWHVFGLLYRSDRNYKEAIKCYLNALRIDPENQQILRDISWLQVQLMDLAGFVESRRKLLVLKPNNKQHWISFAIANYLSKNFESANEILLKFQESSTEEKVRYEHSELLLFQNKCLEADGKVDAALEHLKKSEEDIIDKLAASVKTAELLTLAGRFEEALAQWIDLIVAQPHNYRLHAGAQTAALGLPADVAREMLSLKRLDLPCTVLDLTAAQKERLAALYNVTPSASEMKTIPASKTVNKIVLTLQPTETAFEEALDKYMRKILQEGVPSLCHDVCALMMKSDDASPSRKIFVKDPADFRDNAVCKVALKLVSGYITNLKEKGSFESDSAAVADVPTSLLWSLFLRSHLLEMCGRPIEALADIDECIAHTPTALDMLVKKGRILKKLGDIKGAAKIVNQCRQLDLQDRYLNNKTTKYLLRADQVPEAMTTIEMFTKHDGGDPQYTLFELQCIWYELEMGESYARLGRNGLALKKFYAVEKHFLDFIEDKFDFHSYCIRKGTLRAYLDMVESMQSIFCHRNFQRAARGALKIFLGILEPETPETNANGGAAATAVAEATQELSAADKKKQRKEQKKKEEAAAAAEEAKKAEAKKNPNAQAAIGAPKDEDPNGDKLLLLDPLVEALRWANTISRFPTSEPDTQELVCAVYLKKGKYSLALRALSCGLKVDPFHAGLQLQLFRAARAIEGKEEGAPSVNAAVEVVVKAELARLTGGRFSSEFSASHLSSALARSSLQHRMIAARMTLIEKGAEAGVSDALSFIASPGDADRFAWLKNSKGVSAKTVGAVHKVPRIFIVFLYYLSSDIYYNLLSSFRKTSRTKMLPRSSRPSASSCFPT
jgi:peptide alpha-N-acetyltransferase